MFVRFAELRLRYAMAWNARGADVAGNVPTEGWRLFNEGLAQTEQAILAAPAELKDSPILQNLHLAVVQDISESKTSPRAVFEEGVRRWPDYYDFYEVALTRLVPKWGGSWDAVDAFIAHWSKGLAKTSDALLPLIFRIGESVFERFNLEGLIGMRLRTVDGDLVLEQIDLHPYLNASVVDRAPQSMQAPTLGALMRELISNRIKFAGR